MVLSELLTDLRKLNRADKLYVIQELVSELVQKEELSMQPNDEVLKKKAVLARIRKRWDLLPMQVGDRSPIAVERIALGASNLDERQR